MLCSASGIRRSEEQLDHFCFKFGFHAMCPLLYSVSALCGPLQFQPFLEISPFHLFTFCVLRCPLDLTFGRGSRRYVPPTLRNLSEEQKVKLSGSKPQPEPTAKARPSPARPEAPKPTVARPPPAAPQQRPPPQQRPSPQRPAAPTPTQSEGPRPGPSRPSPDTATSPSSPTRPSAVHREAAPPRHTTPDRARPSVAKRSGASPEKAVGGGSVSAAQSASPAKSTISTRSSASSSSSSSLRSVRSAKAKKTQITPIRLSDDRRTKKYLDLRKGGLCSMKDVFLINNGMYTMDSMRCI